MELPVKSSARGTRQNDTPRKSNVSSTKNDIEFFEVTFFCYYKKGHNMKARTFIKKKGIALGLALTMLIGFSAFKASETSLNKENTVAVQDGLHWYVRDSNGQYSAFTPSPSEENIDDVCPANGPQICALGFENEMNPNELSDADAINATDQRNKPLD